MTRPKSQPDTIVLDNRYGRWTTSPQMLDVLMGKLLPASPKQLRQYFIHERLGGDVERDTYQDVRDVSSLLVMIADTSSVEHILSMGEMNLSKWERQWDKLDAERAAIWAAEDAALEREKLRQEMVYIPHPYVGETIWECDACGLTDRAWNYVEDQHPLRVWVHPETPGDPNEYRSEDDHRE